MKRITTLILGLLCTTIAFAQQPYKMQVGDQLTYHIEAGGEEYDFIVTPTMLAKAGISFDYKMTEPANKEGTINMTGEAIKNSIVMYNRFGGGTVNLSDQVSVFASSAMIAAGNEGFGEFFTEGTSGDAEKFTTLSGNTSPTNNSTYMKLTKMVGGEKCTLDGPIMENADGSKTVRFADGGSYPFITYLEANFKVYLISISRAE